MGWTDIVSAVSLAVIAVMLVICGVAWLRWLRELQRFEDQVERLVTALDYDARPALQSARKLADDAGAVVARVRSEVDGFADSAKDVRERLGKATKAVEERVRDMETVVDLVQFEVEETALDIAAALRTTRRSTQVLRAMKRAFLGRTR